MDSAAEETQYCSNCCRDISSVNFVMHSTHCHRNIKLCKDCQEPVPVSQLDEHFEEFHAKVKCECGDSLEKMHLEEHKKEECMNRPMVCQYCELENPYSKHREHESYCGTRTEPCEKCGKYIMFKNLESHQVTDCMKKVNVPNPGPPERTQLHFENIPPRHFYGHDSSTVARGAPTHVDLPDFHTHEMNSVFDALSGRESVMGDVLSEMNPHLQEALEASAKRNVQQNVSSRIGQRLFRDGTEMQRELNVNQFYSNYEDDDVADEDNLLAMLLANNMSQINIGNDVRNNNSTARNNRVSSPDYMVIDDDDDDMDITANRNNGMDTTVLPCEFCEGLYPADVLLVHQRSCNRSHENGSIEDITVVNDLTPLPSLNSMNRHQFGHILSSDIPISYSMDAVDEASAVQSSKKDKIELPKPTRNNRNNTRNEPQVIEDAGIIPCEFCDEPFPADALWQHQAWCEKEFRSSSSRQGLNNGTRNDPPLPQDNNSAAEANVRQRIRKPVGRVLHNLSDDDDFQPELQRKQYQPGMVSNPRPQRSLSSQGVGPSSNSSYVPSFAPSLSSKSLPNVDNVGRRTEASGCIDEYVPSDLSGPMLSNKRPISTQRITNEPDLQMRLDVSPAVKSKRRTIKTGGIARPANKRPTAGSLNGAESEPVIGPDFFNARPRRTVHKLEKAQELKSNSKMTFEDTSKVQLPSTSSSNRPSGRSTGPSRRTADRERNSRSQPGLKKSSSKLAGSPPER